MKKILYISAAAFFITVLFSSCGVNPEKAIIGKWALAGYDCDGNGINCKETFLEEEMQKRVYDYKLDDDFTALLLIKKDDGTVEEKPLKYKVHSNKLYHVVDNNIEIFDIISINSDSMVLQVEKAEDKSKVGRFLLFKKVK